MMTDPTDALRDIAKKADQHRAACDEALQAYREYPTKGNYRAMSLALAVNAMGAVAEGALGDSCECPAGQATIIYDKHGDKYLGRYCAGCQKFYDAKNHETTKEQLKEAGAA